MKLLKKLTGFVLMLAALCTVNFCSGAMNHAAAAEAPYYTYTADKDGDLVATKDGYLPYQLYERFDGEKLNKPSDLFIDEEGTLYIADTGNQRVLICGTDGTVRSVITEGLMAPSGLYVTEEGIYVADTRAETVFLFSGEGQLLHKYGKPDNPLFGKSSKYAPKKVAVDSAGSLYIISEGNTNGILNISSKDDFFGYFGVNETGISLGEMIKRITFTQEQKDQLQRNVPPSAANLSMDERGLVYTVTKGSKNGIKKYNIAGKNILNSYNYGDSHLTDITVGEIENFYTLSADGYIYEYSREGNLLFVFGGADDGNNRTGLFVAPAAIDVGPDGRLYVLDSERGTVTSFNRTEYAGIIHSALELYQQGKYVESREPWEEAYRQNSLFDYVQNGLGKSYLKLGMYGEALQSFERGGDYAGYSDAFWEVRNEWLRDHLAGFLGIILAIAVVWKLIAFWNKKKGVLAPLSARIARFKEVRLVRELSFTGYMHKNPADAFYGIKKEGKVSVQSAALLYAFIFFIFLVNKYFSGFLFKTVREDEFNLMTDFVLCPGLMLLTVFCLNLIGSIRDGEGSLKDIFCSFAYCFTPYLFLKPLVIALSYIVTFNEGFIISLLNFIIYAGCGILLFVMIKEIQAYKLSETVKCILITLFTMVMLVIGGVIMFALVNQLWEFLVGVGKEAMFRVR